MLEKEALKELHVEPRARCNLEIESADPVERVLRHYTVGVGKARDVVLATARVDRLGAQDDRAEILAQGRAELIYLIMPRLYNTVGCGVDRI